VVETKEGRFEAEQLVITPGPWAPQLLSDLGLPLEVERQVLYWFHPTAGIELFRAESFPIFIWDAGDGLQPYGFPAIDGLAGGVKVALYRAPVSAPCTPENVERAVDASEIGFMRETISRLLPSLDGPCLNAVTCLYTNTPDRNFIVARHPRHPRVSIACGFSGHGFKFASVIGEVLADLVTTGATPLDLDFLRPERFAA
jgi:sarcosine oxidase